MKDNLTSIKILGTRITTASKEEILEYILKRHQDRADKFYIVTPNPEILKYAVSHASFKGILNDAKVSLPDGIGVLVAARFLGKSIIGRIAGVDFMQELCSEYAKRPITVGFLGGRGGVAKMTADCLQKKYPGLKVGFVSDEWPDGKMVNGQWSIVNNSETQSLVIPYIDMLFVAFGFPKQEEWIAKNLSEIPVTAAMTVGGAFDYISGKIPRAPKLIRQIGFEWAFRLMVQPSRLKRQLALPQFVAAIIKEKIKSLK